MPKPFQIITADYGRRLLAESAIALTPLNKKMGFPLCVEIKTQPKNKAVEIHYGFHPSPFGHCLVALSMERLCAVFFFNKREEKKKVTDLRRRWPEASLIKNEKETRSWGQRIFSGQKENKKTKLPLILMGTDFQLKVWRALLRITPGSVCSYEAVAHMIRQPNAIRAAGTAIGANPIGYLIPCHRVIRKGGAIGNYRWGVQRKKAMLGIEALNS